MDREREDGSEDGGELTSEERTLLLRWQPPGPPGDFAARVLDEPRPSGAAERGSGGAAVGAKSEDRGAATGGATASVWSKVGRRGAATGSAAVAAESKGGVRGAATSGAAASVGSGQRGAAAGGAAASGGSAGSQRGRAIAWGAGAVVLAAAAAMALSLRSSGAPGKMRGAAAPTFAELRWMKERESIALGGRGIAVAEAGAALGWRRTGDSARVEQEAGDVFYRVDPGGPFTVTTAAGEVRVTGTCFRVEVISMKPSKQGWIGAAAGAALATAVVVTVYEGKVVVASPSGSAQVRAGERATLAPDVPPALATSATPSPSVALAELPPAPPNATREELLARDEAMRQQVASLAQRLRQLQTVASAAPSEEPKARTFDSKESWTDVPAETLLEFARECRVQIDFPPMNAGPFKLSPKLAEQLELSSDEVAAANQTFAELHASWLRRLRALYVETTGDNAGAESLSMQALSEELREKAAGEGEAEALQKRIAEERAGLLPVPTDLTRTSPYERYFRSFANLGDEAEALIAGKLGKEKAHALRASDGGWPMRMGLAGCREGEKASGADAP